MDKIGSLLKKAQNLDFDAFNEGKKNYENPILCVEVKAEERAKICAGCDSNIKEPIKQYRIKDNIHAISERSCKECGCLLPYLLRQNIKSCKLNKWNAS